MRAEDLIPAERFHFGPQESYSGAMRMDVIRIDDRFLTPDEAQLPVTDLAVLRGYGVFDFTRTYNRVPFCLDTHVRRLARSARLLGLSLPCPEEEIIERVHETVGRSDHPEANVRIVVTGGESTDGFTPEGRSRLVIMVTAIRPRPEQWYSRGVKVVTHHAERFCPGAKTTNYIPAILAMKSALRQGAIESIYVDRHQRLLEGTTSNLFVFFGDRLITPEADILYGITRQTVLTLAAPLFPIERRDIKVDDLRLFDEVFICSSNKEVVPVVDIDNIVVGAGVPGERTRRIMAAFRDFTASYGR